MVNSLSQDEEVTIFNVFDKLRTIEGYLFFDDILGLMNIAFLTKNQKSDILFTRNELIQKYKDFVAYYKYDKNRILAEIFECIKKSFGTQKFSSIEITQSGAFYGVTLLIRLKWQEEKIIYSKAGKFVDKIDKDANVYLYFSEVSFELLTPEDLSKDSWKQSFIFEIIGHRRIEFINKYYFYTYNHPEYRLSFGETGVSTSLLQIDDLVLMPKLIYDLSILVVLRIPKLLGRITGGMKNIISEIKLPKLSSLSNIKANVKTGRKLASELKPVQTVEHLRGVSHRGAIGNSVDPEIDRAVERSFIEEVRSTGYKPRARPQKSVFKGNAEEARKIFEKLRGQYADILHVGKGGQVHHAIELQVLDRYPNVYTQSELNSLANMRGIKAEDWGKMRLHNSAVRLKIDETYRFIDKQILEKNLKIGSIEYNKLVRETLSESVGYNDWLYSPLFTETRSTLDWARYVLPK